MKGTLRRAIVLAFFLAMGTTTSPGLSTEQIGPDENHPTTEQPEWSAGIVELPRDESRVYASWTNGSENFYFRAPDAAAINGLLEKFLQSRLRDHEVWLKEGKPRVDSFNQLSIGYNVHLSMLSGIALFFTRTQADAEKAETFEPKLTIFVDPDQREEILQGLVIPDHVILHNELPNSELKGKRTKPERRFWHAKVMFDEERPAVDLEGGVNTALTLWSRDDERGIHLGKLSREGMTSVAFSEKERALLDSGEWWLTLTVGNWLEKAKPDDQKVDPSFLSQVRESAKPIYVDSPGYFYGRLLFEDGSPPVLDPEPWPGAEIKIEFPFGGSGRPDEEGYFKIFFSEQQFEEATARKVRKNIYLPLYGERGRSRAMHAFPASVLSRDKDQAGVIRIPKPTP